MIQGDPLIGLKIISLNFTGHAKEGLSIRWWGILEKREKRQRTNR